MNIQLGYSEDLENKVRKTFTLKDTYTCSMKDNVSVISPSVYISAATFSNRAYNYAYIPFLNRYYFITDIILRNANTIEISLKVDVLKSFESVILGTNTMVERSQNNGNEYLNDTMLPLSTKRLLQIKKLGSFDTSLKNYLVVTNGGETNE